VVRPHNEKGLAPEEFLRRCAQEDTLSQSLQRRAAKPVPYIILTIRDPWCDLYAAQFPELKAFIHKDKYKCPSLRVMISDAKEPEPVVIKTQSFSENRSYNPQPSSEDPGPLKTKNHFSSLKSETLSYLPTKTQNPGPTFTTLAATPTTLTSGLANAITGYPARGVRPRRRRPTSYKFEDDHPPSIFGDPFYPLPPHLLLSPQTAAPAT